MASNSSTIRLSNANLNNLREEVATPKYDRSALRQHTVHMGVGGFHRAHQAVYLDDLLANERSERWGECGVGVLPSDARMRDAMQGQDCLYTVVERSAAGQAARVIGSMVDYILASEHRESAIERLAAPDTRIVSLTVTEGGYFIDEATGEFLIAHPDIQHDIQHPTEPVTSMGLLVEALERRKRRGVAPFTLMSCDNLQGNGDVARRVLLALAELSNPPLGKWIADNVAFPNSMVDRITPATTPSDIAQVAERFGVEDAWPVVTEPFRQWVIEDHFCNGRPRWEEVRAQLIADVAPFEIMKMRLLNGSHLAMAYLGALNGFPYVHEIMQDQLFYSFIAEFMEEVTPVVPRIPNVSVSEYKQSLMERFSNPTINDQVTRICSEGSAKLPKWLLPSIAQLLQEGRPTRFLSLVVASWIFYLGRGSDERGQPLNIIDARAAELMAIARKNSTDPRPMLAVKSIFGESLPANHSFVQSVQNALTMLASNGVCATLRHYLSADGKVAASI